MRFDQALDEGETEVSSNAIKGGIPTWLILVLCVATAGYFLFARAGEEPNVDETSDVSPTTQPVEPAVQPVEVVEVRTQLSHSEMAWVRLGNYDLDLLLAVRSGSTIVVVDPTEPMAHQINLPTTEAQGSGADHGGRSLALVADKVIVIDNGFLRSLSTRGGVDVLLSNSSVGFEVASPTAIVAAVQPVRGSENAGQTRLARQGVHYPTASRPADAFGQPVDRELLPEGSALIAVQEKLFVETGGAWHRSTPEGLVSLGPGRVFAAGANHAIVEQCLVEFDNCSYIRIALDGSGEVELETPPEFSRSEVVLSTDGNEIFVLDDGTSAQKLVDISDGRWSIIREVARSRFTAATFGHEDAMLVLATEGSLVFWRDGKSIAVWGLSNIGHIDEIAIARPPEAS